MSLTLRSTSTRCRSGAHRLQTLQQALAPPPLRATASTSLVCRPGEDAPCYAFGCGPVTRSTPRANASYACSWLNNIGLLTLTLRDAVGAEVGVASLLTQIVRVCARARHMFARY